MHLDGPIEDRTTEIKEDRGPYDVGSCPLFTSDVDASRDIGPHRTDEKQRIHGIVRSRPTIVA